MKPKILVFGEVLFDLFDDKAQIGGAPFNFAAHFASLGGEADLVSAVGGDDLGKTALAEMKKRGIGDRYVGVNGYKTGYCQVTIKNDVPSYDLKQGVAYDYIEAPKITGKYDALYFGTLSQRGEGSRKALEKLFERGGGEVFYDINIRPPFYTAEILEKSLRRATILKISREEAGVLLPYGEPRAYCEKILEQYPNLCQVVLTLDKDGAAVLDRAQGWFLSPTPDVRVVSTVGAGDAFGACYLYHRLCGHSIGRCLEAASMLSGHVVAHLGAVPELPEELKEKII